MKLLTFIANVAVATLVSVKGGEGVCENKQVFTIAAMNTGKVMILSDTQGNEQLCQNGVPIYTTQIHLHTNSESALHESKARIQHLRCSKDVF